MSVAFRFSNERTLLERLFSPQKPMLLRLGLMLLALGGFLAFTAAPWRAFQLWSFCIPFALIWLSQAEQHSKAAGCLKLIAFLGFSLSILDGGIRGFIRRVYSAEPASSFVIESVANTNSAESLDFVATVLPDILAWTFPALALLGIVGGLMFVRLPQSMDAPAAKWLACPLIGLLVLVTLLSWSVRPWRKQLPPLYWAQWVEKVVTMKSQWANLALQWQKEAVQAAESFIAADPTPKTIVLMIGESTARDHWSLYGYSRKTTPKLDERAARDPRFLTVRNVWSVDGSTIAAFKSMFLTPEASNAHAGNADAAPRENVFALFRQAGWKITWISNQEDLAIRNQFAHWANEQIFLNRIGGRSSRSLDERVLPPLEDALTDPAERHLIVVHLIGAHPHYSLRFPAEWQSDWPEDAVEDKLKSLDRSPWVMKAIDTYDTVMRYQDLVLDASLNLAEHAASRKKPVIWAYISDHGQELGESENRTGHSQTTPDGYRVPLVLWSSDNRLSRKLVEKPFRADLLDSLMLSAAGIRRKDEISKEVFFSKDYDFDAPNLPMKDSELEAADRL